MRRSLAVVVSMPGREKALVRAVDSLRPQVDYVALYWNGPAEKIPDVNVHYWIADPSNERGSGAKLYWADQWDGLYLACDDDLAYPPDYVATMRRWVDHWDRQALVTCHGRVLKPDAARFKDATFTAHALRDVPVGRWLNYPGGCALAFDTSLNVPANMEGKNVEEAQLAIWAQWNRVPIWLVPHTGLWLEYLLPLNGNHYTIFADEASSNFKNRNSYLAPQASKGWTVHEPVAVAA